MHRCLIFSLFRFSEETYKHTHLLSNVAGEDLLAIAADQPFRFPATFTFVVRAFSGWVWMTKSTISCILKCNCLPLMVNFSYWQFWMGLGKDLTQDLTSLRLPNRESWSCGSLAVSLYTKHTSVDDWLACFADMPWSYLGFEKLALKYSWRQASWYCYCILLLS